VWKDDREAVNQNRLTACGQLNCSGDARRWCGFLPMPGNYKVTVMPGSDCTNGSPKTNPGKIPGFVISLAGGSRLFYCYISLSA